MNKKILSVLVLSAIFAGNAFAFDVNGAPEDQVETATGVVFSESVLMLGAETTMLKEVYFPPNFPSLYEMYLNTGDGIYLNRQFEGQWSLHAGLSELFPQGVNGLAFDGNYATSKTMLTYTADKAVISYNNGDSWGDITPDIEEDILLMDFGPNFNSNAQIYFITASGLYRKAMTSDKIDLVLAAEESGSITDFNYQRTQTSDAIFYVVEGSKLMKTENFGDDFLTHDFGAKIVDFEIIDDSTSSVYLLVLTEDNRLFYSDKNLSVRELSLPEEITQIFNAGEIIDTDMGLYITYNEGDSWGKLNYDTAQTSAITWLEMIYEGGDRSLYLINDNTLYRDVILNDTLEEYMEGVDTTAEYVAEGTANSRNLLEIYPEQFADNYLVNSATLSADGDLNGQTMTFYMTADGENWEEVVLDEEMIFAAPGTDLRWKVVMATDDTAVTPVLRSVSVNFGMEEEEEPADETICAGFPDVPADDPLCPAITYVRDRGIFEGYPDGNFKPDEAINRAETVKVITEGFDIPLMEDDGTTLGFSDVIVGEWYMGYLRTAKEGGVIEGYPNGTFKPEQTVNYVEMMKIFLETAGADLITPPADAAWYAEYVDFAKANNLVEYAQLDAGMKRGDVALLFYQWSLR